MDTSWAAPGSKTSPRRLLDASWAALGRLLGRLGRLVVVNMAPTGLPKRSQNRQKIDPKIERKIDIPRNRF